MVSPMPRTVSTSVDREETEKLLRSTLNTNAGDIITTYYHRHQTEKERILSAKLRGRT